MGDVEKLLLWEDKKRLLNERLGKAIALHNQANGTDFTPPKIVIRPIPVNSKGNRVKARFRKGQIEVQRSAVQRDFENILNSTMPHEAAHFIVRSSPGGRFAASHGKRFRKTLDALTKLLDQLDTD